MSKKRRYLYMRTAAQRHAVYDQDRMRFVCYCDYRKDAIKIKNKLNKRRKKR